MKQDSGCAKLFLYVFILVFSGVGAGMIYGSVGAFQESDTPRAVMMLVAGLAFGAVGVGLLAMVIAGSRRQEREQALRAMHPGQPWMWRDDWAAGRVRSTGKGATWFLWAFTIIWNLISMPLVISIVPQEVLEKENYGALVALLFPLVGIGLIIAAVRKTIQMRKYGNCLFLMDSVPGVLGGELSGRVYCPRGLPDAQTLLVRLSCIHRWTTGSGKNRSTHEEVLWQTEEPEARLVPAGDGIAQQAAARFRVPYDANPTAEAKPDDEILWKVQASASVPGVDFDAGFEVPVYKTQASSPQVTEEQLRSEEVMEEDRSFLFSEPAQNVSVVPSAGGGTEFVFKPREGRKGAFPALAIVLVFAAIVVFLISAGAPIIFPIVFGGFTLLIVFALLFGAFGESRIIIEQGEVSVRNSMFGIMRGRRMKCSSIKKISVKGDARPGNRGYYSVVLTRDDGKTVSPMQLLPDKRQADWLAEELRKTMEPWRRGTVNDAYQSSDPRDLMNERRQP